MLKFIKRLVGTAQERRVKHYAKVVAEVNQAEEALTHLTDEELKQKTEEFRDRFAKGESLDQLLPEAYATVKQCCRRLCGSEVHVSGYSQQWDMVPYDVQILGAIAMHHGSIAEMQTGEGKTLTATMPLYLNALAGSTVHLVTVNDYLAQRDCEWVGEILRWLGLTTAVLTGSTPPHARREIYRADVVYGTAAEFGFDYLRDNSIASRKEEQVQGKHYFAIIDEIDSILIDEARTPLIISGPVPESRQMYDHLKGGVASLVRKQREICTKEANEARRTLERLNLLSEDQGEDLSALSKEDGAAAGEALRLLWKVGCGMPRHRIVKRAREQPQLRDELDRIDLHFHAEQNKEERQKWQQGLLLIVDERTNEFELTDSGIQSWAGVGGAADDFVMLDLGYAYHEIDMDSSLSENERIEKKLTLREEDAQRKERAHNLRQLLRAHLLMERDVDYIVQDNRVVIIDENTGRPQPGRRFSDGLHQAIEAKEGVTIQQETQTYATITLQNYFRLYQKLSGMTGTAMTEANEFKEIYKLDVLEIPTYRPCIRKGHDDQIYMTEREKYLAIIQEIERVHGEERPILIGTDSVEISEKLSRILNQNRLPHNLLNAKVPEQEASIIAGAGEAGAITIATNMAGRGTDIKLSAPAKKAGGLHVIGASRHQSRRIDRQLLGRSARLGDPGSYIFFVSFEDALMRKFSSRALNALLKRLRPPENEPIVAPILNHSIANAQKRLEQRNYMIRKHTLEYDDVMNRQRKEVYAFRNEILHREETIPIATEILKSVCTVAAENCYGAQAQDGSWDKETLRQWLMQHFPVTFEEDVFDDEFITLDKLSEQIFHSVHTAFRDKIEAEREKSSEEHSPLLLDMAIRSLMLRSLDQLWQEHLLQMDYLRGEVGLRAIGEKDPLMEFKREAFALFDQLSEDLHNYIATSLFRFQIVRREEGFLQERLRGGVHLERSRSLAPNEEATGNTSPIRELLDQQKEKAEKRAQEEGTERARNSPCPCGSGKKYKRCCGLKQLA